MERQAQRADFQKGFATRARFEKNPLHCTGGEFKLNVVPIAPVPWCTDWNSSNQRN